MNLLLHWVGAAAVALAMSIAWDDDEALQATADDVRDAIEAAQTAASEEPAWPLTQ